MLANQVSSVGVVSHERGRALVASLSASDLTDLRGRPSGWRNNLLLWAVRLGNRAPEHTGYTKQGPRTAAPPFLRKSRQVLTENYGGA